MKKCPIIVGVLLIIGGVLLMYNSYYKSYLLCEYIHKDQTEEALQTIETMRDVNTASGPHWIRPLLNVVEYTIEIPLVEACIRGNDAVIDSLLKHGADPNYSLSGGFTATEAALLSNSEETLKILEQLESYGADFTRAESGESPLFLAARKMLYARDNKESVRRNADCVRYLMRFDKNVTEADGDNILLYAVLVEDYQLIENILKLYPELIYQIGPDGLNTLEYAEKNASKEIFDFLSKRTVSS